MRKTSTLMIAATAVLTLLVTLPVAAQEWKYDAVLYGWLTGLDGTIGVSEVAGGQPVEAKFSDLANYLDFAAAGHFEAHNPKVVLITDINYVKLGSEREVEVLRNTVKAKTDFTQWILEAGGGYRVSPKFDLLLAGRYYILDLASVAGQKTSEANHNWGDVFIGGRYHTVFGEKWLLSLRGDVGLGGSSFAWFGNAVLGYQASDLFSLGLMYRILSLDYETGAGADFFKYDITYNGVGLAFGFSF